MTNVGKLISEDIENYIQDIVKTSLNFIPFEYKGIYLMKLAQVTTIHKENMKIIIENDLKSRIK